MQNILTASQMRETDAYTVTNEPIASIDLMERASLAFVNQLFAIVNLKKSQPLLICCGTGNNGGDGLAIGRLLHDRGFTSITIWVVKYNAHQSANFKTNYQRLTTLPLKLYELLPGDELPTIEQELIIDAMLGAGLNKPLSGNWLSLIRHINKAKKRVVAVDLPTGMPADGQLVKTIEALFAQEVITFQQPKISFLFPESANFMERFHVVDIGLNRGFIARQTVDFYEVTDEDVRGIYKKRLPFSHKGTYGHSLLIAGSEDTMGAALLCAEACLYTGSGLTTLCIPQCGFIALNSRLPEIMAIERGSLFEENLDKYKAIAIGPGLGMGKETTDTVQFFLTNASSLVLDADALNCLAEKRELLDMLPTGTILTPHMKEFDRLFGDHANWWDRVEKARAEAIGRKLVIVLKNRFTFIALPSGQIAVNFTGNPAMASGGMGDVLTGIVVALLAQGYNAADAAILACYLHGTAGDLLAKEGMAISPASMLIKKIPKVIGDLFD